MKVSFIPITALFACLVISAVPPVGAPAQGEETNTGSAHTPGPGNIYREQADDGIPVRLQYFAPRPEAMVTFSFDQPDRPPKGMPSIEDQGRILDHLLGRLLDEHADVPASFQFSPGSSRDALMEVLDRKLAEPDANWDPKHGVPLHGTFGDVLKDELNKVIQSSPIGKAFEAHNYGLKLTGIGRIDMQRIKALGGARLPVFMYAMEIEAIKTPTKG